MGISPTTIELQPNQTQQFSQSGISSPIWIVSGDGSVNSSGLYTAPNAAGSAIVKAAESIYASYTSSHTTKNADDTLTVISSSLSFPALKPKLNSIGDYVEFEWWQLNVAEITLTQSGVTWSVGAGSEYAYQSSPYQLVGLSSYISVGSKVRMQLASGNTIQVWVNGTLRHTFSGTWTSGTAISISMYLRSGTTVGTVIKRPVVGGSGISNYTEYQSSVTISPPLLLGKNGLELYCESSALTLSDNAVVTSLTDLSGNSRHLTASSNQPVFKTSDKRIEFDGTKSPLKNTSQFQINCGFILAKCNQSTFLNDAGLLSGNEFLPILLGSQGTNKFFDLQGAGDTKFEHFEFRTNDRIYPQSNQIAPMAEWKLIFFRFWQPQITDGIQIGCDRLNSSRKWNGAVKLLALYSRNFCETDIRLMAKTIANAYSLTLADVFPFNADESSEIISSKKVLRSGNDEFGSVTRVKRAKKLKFKLNFTNRKESEIDSSDSYLDDHHPELPFIIRNYQFIPPRDTEVYSLSNEVTRSTNGINLWNYSFEAREK